MGEHLYNLNDRSVKTALMSTIGTMTGLWTITMKRRRPTRTLDQNKYYFVAVVTPLAEWMREEWQEDVSVEQAHEILKNRMLEARQYGDIVIPPSTTKLQIDEFSKYVEDCARWLAENFGIVVIPSREFYGEEHEM